MNGLSKSILILTVLIIGGCASQARYYSSVVDYLYPDQSAPVEKTSIPVMNLPMKIAIAFVPDQGSRRQNTFWENMASGPGKKPGGLVFPEKNKADLMKEVRDHFKDNPIIKSIEIIPSAYLVPGGSFSNLDQIQTMYGVDAIVLLSYDQVQFTDEGAASFLYWTLIGAYIVPGEKNTTQTMMDAAVYDIKSRKMLFRAPGLSLVKGSSTPVSLSASMRKDSEQGFDLAAKDMVINLDTQLGEFMEKVKSSPAEYKVVASQEYLKKRGGGSLGIVFSFLSVLLAAGILWKGKYS